MSQTNELIGRKFGNRRNAGVAGRPADGDTLWRIRVHETIGRQRNWYWRDHYQQRPYFEAGRDFDYYRPAYRFGFDARDRYEGDEWSDIESDLSRDWDDYKDRGRSTWQQVKDASGTRGTV